MKLKDHFPEPKDEGEVVAYFGSATLVKRLDCRFEMVGGSDVDRATGRDWMPRFMSGAAD